MESRKAFTILLIIVLGAVSVLPSQDIKIVLLKLFVAFFLLLVVASPTSTSRIEKKLQVLVADVRPDRRDEYRAQLLAALSRYSPARKLDEKSGEVAVAVDADCSVEDLKRSVDACELKILYERTAVVMHYTSLEVSAGLQVTISGIATPGSVVIIDGVSREIKVNESGVFSVQVPIALIRKYEAQGHIPAHCRKGSLNESIRIPLSS